MPTVIQVRVDRAGAEPEVVDLDLDLDTFTMRESVRLEQALGSERFERLLTRGLTGSEVSPIVIQAVIYAKLKTKVPGLELDDFDVNLEDLYEALEPDPKVRAATSNGGSPE